MGFTCTEQLVNISNWTLDDRIKDRLKGSGFEHLNISICRHHARLLESIASKFDTEKCIFEFQNFCLLFGLRDVLYITGLHITGKPVTGIDDDPVTWSEKCFGENLCKVSKKNKFQGSIRLNVLKAKFMNVPDNAIDEVLDRHARAYVCYMLGSSLFSTADHDHVPTMYLPLVFEVQKIKDYAWGAAALAHLYCSLKRFKENNKYLNGIAFSLQIFFILSLPKIKSSIIASVENGNQNESFPLIVDWSKNLKEYNTRRQVEFLDIIDTMTDTEVVYNPYVSLKFTRDQDLTFKVQDCVCSIATPLINFNEIAFYKPYECKKQYPGRHTKKLDDKWELFYRGGARSKEHWGNNWTTKRYHKKFINQWDESCFSKRPFDLEEGEDTEMAQLTQGYVVEGGTDEEYQSFNEGDEEEELKRIQGYLVEGGSEVEFHSFYDGYSEEGEEVEKEYEDKEKEFERIQGDIAKEETRVEYHNLDQWDEEEKSERIQGYPVEEWSVAEFHSFDDGDGEEGERVEEGDEDKEEESKRIQVDIVKEETRVEHNNFDEGSSTSKRIKLMITNLGQRLGFLPKN